MRIGGVIINRGLNFSKNILKWVGGHNSVILGCKNLKNCKVTSLPPQLSTAEYDQIQWNLFLFVPTKIMFRGVLSCLKQFFGN